MKYGIITLAILFAGMGIILLSSADVPEKFTPKTQTDELNDGFAADDAPVMPAEDTGWELPQLEFKESPEYVVIDGVLSTMEGENLFTIPVGSIIHHSADGITTIFTADGKYYLSAIDAEAKKSAVPGGGGYRPGTQVFQVPSGSDITTQGNVTWVRFNSKIIMTVVNETG